MQFTDRPQETSSEVNQRWVNLLANRLQAEKTSEPISIKAEKTASQSTSSTRQQTPHHHNQLEWIVLRTARQYVGRLLSLKHAFVLAPQYTFVSWSLAMETFILQLCNSRHKYPGKKLTISNQWPYCCISTQLSPFLSIAHLQASQSIL